LRNNLDRETSPYLLQHRDNPVHWQPWGSEAFAQARAGNKPVLLSVGYAACHWCHVMAHESFEDDDIAELMNELFVSIKVDREERPDVDAIYQMALALTGQHGGWPLTMFLTPEGEPFWGGTYFPAEAKYGRPGFPDVLRRVAEVYHGDREAIEKNTTALVDALNKLSAPAAGDGEGTAELTPRLLDEVAGRIVREVDRSHGGIGGAPKFPQPFAFALLWRAWRRSGERRYREAVETTLTRICQGGIYDHLGGGFARYATDERWLVPHFEKMLYDNAQLIELLTRVWQDTSNPLYAERVAETVTWLEREMIAEDGGFAASLDADSEGEEGRFYVWNEAEIDAVLPPEDRDLFKQVYDVTQGGNWEGHTILNRIAHPEPDAPEQATRLARCRELLLAARAQRVRPGWDDKVLADWNGLTIAALAEAAAVFERPRWLALAERAFDFISTRMSDGARLWHAHRAGRSQHAGMLEDYAAMARAALRLHELTGSATALQRAIDWVEVVEQQFLDARHGGYFQSAADAGDLVVRLRSSSDNAVPSGNGLMGEVLTRLWLLTGEERYRARADALFQAFAPELGRNFFPMTTYLNSLELMLRPLQVAIVGQRGEAGTDALVAAAIAAAGPDRVLQVAAPDAALPAGHPAAGKGQQDGRPTAYVCVGPTCSLPLTDADALRQALRDPPA
jgi:uncharacterized protein YyaL (SSP411 family)